MPSFGSPLALLTGRAAALALAASLLAGCGAGTTVGNAGPVPGGSPAPGSPSGPTGTPTPRASASPAPGPSVTLAPGTTPTPTSSPASPGPATVTPIKHIVILIQENRSFDNLFHGFTEPSGAKADYADVGYDKAGNAIPLTQTTFNNIYDPGHSHGDFIADFDNGKNDGFKSNNNGSTATVQGSNNGYAYIDQSEVQPYFDMAHQGALAQKFFHGITGPTWVSHLMFAAGSTTYDGLPNDRVDGNPGTSLGWGCEDGMPNDTTTALAPDGTERPGPFPCFTGVTTIADLLQNANHTWRYYSGPIQPPGTTATVGGQTVTTPGGNLNALASYRQIYYGPNWTANDIQPETRILTDDATTLADVTYVVPEAENSDHSQGGTSTGPEWVSSVVNTIGASPFYNSTAIFVTWDDWGGWYDHVPPPQKYAPYGLSFRIPLIAISPYAKHGQLIDTQLEPGSILKFVEETFGLPSLGTTDATSNSASAMFDFTQKPAAFTPIASKLGPRYFLTRHPDYRAVDKD